MKYFSPFRLASYLLMLFFVGHTARGVFALVASHACNALLSWTYFFAGPGIFATIVTILLAAGAWLKQRAR